MTDVNPVDAEPLARGLSLLAPHVQLAEMLTGRADGVALDAARMASALGEPVVARALLARAGGLLDAGEAQIILGEPLPAARLTTVHALKDQHVPLPSPARSRTETEMLTRVLAGVLLLDDPWSALGGAHMTPPPGFWLAPPRPPQDRWALAQRWVQGTPEPQMERQSPASFTLAAMSWGGRCGAALALGTAGAHVIATERLVNLLGAAWPWDLPALPALLSQPLIIDDLHSLSPELLHLLSELVTDAARLFGWSVLGLPGLDRDWPAACQPLPPGALSEWAQLSASCPTAASQAACTVEGTGDVRLAALAHQLQAQPGSALIVLPSRASAARLAGLLPGSHLLSTSLCPTHLDQQVTHLLTQPHEGPLRLVVTTLPPAQLGPFDHVWHVQAPLPFLAEAAQLCSGTFHIFTSEEVAVPFAWTVPLTFTAQALQTGTLFDPDVQKAYTRALDEASDWAWLEGLRADRLMGRYASLASQLRTRPGTSVPILIPFDAEARQVIADYRAEGRLLTTDLRFVAWLTQGEARVAVQRGLAEPVAWALVWKGPYDPQYGLARAIVEQARDQQ